MPGRLNVVADLLSRIPEDVRSETGELDGAADSEDLNSTEVCSATIMLSRQPSAETRAKQLKNKEKRPSSTHSRLRPMEILGSLRGVKSCQERFCILTRQIEATTNPNLRMAEYSEGEPR